MSESSSSSGPIDQCIERWHQHIAHQLPGGLDSVLHADVVFFSPVVFSPQEGRDVTKMYLTAAAQTLGGGNQSAQEQAKAKADGTAFRYTKQLLAGHQAVLEFETTLDGKSVNGVDIITCDDESMITEFKVMVRPLQAIQAVQQQMMTMLETMQADA